MTMLLGTLYPTMQQQQEHKKTIGVISKTTTLHVFAQPQHENA